MWQQSSSISWFSRYSRPGGEGGQQLLICCVWIIRWAILAQPLVSSLIGMQFFIKYPIKNPVCMSNRFVVAHSVPRYFVADRGHYPKFFIFILFLILIFSRLNFFRHFFLYFSNKFYLVLISAGQKMIFSKTSAEGSPCWLLEPPVINLYLLNEVLMCLGNFIWFVYI